MIGIFGFQIGEMSLVVSIVLSVIALYFLKKAFSGGGSRSEADALTDDAVKEAEEEPEEDEEEESDEEDDDEYKTDEDGYTGEGELNRQIDAIQNPKIKALILENSWDSYDTIRIMIAIDEISAPKQILVKT